MLAATRMPPAWLLPNRSRSPATVFTSYEYGTRTDLTPALPYPRPEQFADTVALLGPKNDKLAKIDVPSILDPSFVKSAEERGLAK